MRWGSTDVFPVPAPATTSIGPWTCSIASHCRSSGTNGAERELDFNAIAGSISSAAMRKPVRNYTAPEGVHRRVPHPCRVLCDRVGILTFLSCSGGFGDVPLPCLRIHLEDSERISFGVHEVPLPAGIRHGKFGQGHDSPKLLNAFRGRVEILD